MEGTIPVVKNSRYEILIKGLGAGGEGIGQVEGFTVFVPGGVPGDLLEVLVVAVKKRYAYGKLLSVIRPSEDRVTPKCPHFSKCGGCQLSHMSYPAQLAYKSSKVLDCITRIGGICASQFAFLPILSADTPVRYRNKAQFPVGRNADGQVVTGFFAQRSHRIIPVSHCMIQHPLCDEILQRVRQFMEEYRISVYQEEAHTGLVRHVVTKTAAQTKEAMVCLVINGTGLPHQDALIASLTELPEVKGILLNFNQERTNVVLGPNSKTIWGKDRICERIGAIEYEISLHSFFQVNPEQTKRLYDTVLSFCALDHTKNVLDLYCGIGSISLFLAKEARQVVGVEVVPEAIADAEKNREKNGIKNASFYLGKAEEIAPKLHQEGLLPDVVVVDPPRKGCDPVALDAICHMQPERIVYVSCDPATLARDLKVLTEGGYVLKKVQPVDMFPQTASVESVALLQRAEK